MKIKKLEDNTLLVPERIEDEGVEGDTILEIKPDHIDYEKYFKQYEREQILEKNEGEGKMLR